MRPYAQLRVVLGCVGLGLLQGCLSADKPEYAGYEAKITLLPAFGAEYTGDDLWVMLTFFEGAPIEALTLWGEGEQRLEVLFRCHESNGRRTLQSVEVGWNGAKRATVTSTSERTKVSRILREATRSDYLELYEVGWRYFHDEMGRYFLITIADDLTSDEDSATNDVNRLVRSDFCEGFRRYVSLRVKIGMAGSVREIASEMLKLLGEEGQ